MNRYSFSSFTDPALLHAIAELVARERVTTAELIACLAEVDARKLYVPAGYPSMHAWCVGELRMSDDATYRRIQAGRMARQFPALLPLLAEGRLQLTGVLLLAPYLRRENAAELVAAAAGRSKSEIEAMLAHRYPRSEELGMVEAAARAGTLRGVPTRSRAS